MKYWNPYESWDRQHLESKEDMLRMKRLFEMDNPVVGGGDTETNGLHIKKAKPFLIIFGWLIPGEEDGRVFTFKPTPFNMQLCFKLAEKLKAFVWWNAKYDLHMMTNIGFRYDKPNLFEGIALARCVVESIPARNGGDSMQLKHIGATYVHPEANAAERRIKELKRTIQAERVKILTTAIKQFDHPTDTVTKFIKLETGKGTTEKWALENPDKVDLISSPAKWTKKRIEDFIKDVLHEPEELPEDLRDFYQDWLAEYYPDHYPGEKLEPTYLDIYQADPEAMIKYAGDDVITMLEFYRKAVPIVKSRAQQKVIKRENSLILPLYRMERVGIRVDREYLERSRQTLKAVIKQKRHRMWEICGQECTVGQDVLLKSIFRDKWNIEMEKCDKKALKDVARKHKGTEAEELSIIIRSLRRLEKWYSTYCVRILNITSHDGRYYTQIAQCSAVSGRVGSDGQQFPKERILTDEGQKYEDEHGDFTAPESEEIFFPRRAFIPTDKGKEEGYNAIYYLDYSQIELRNQADYTLKVSGGDLRMCRAYMPFRCVHYATGKEYDYQSPSGRLQWNEKQPNGKSVWLMPDENNKPWTPTDVHSETTHNALVELGYECLEKYKHYKPGSGMPERSMIFGRELDEKGFKMARYKGKIFNFMKNYGGGMRAAMDQLDLPEVAAKALIAGYETAFPHVVVYQDKVVRKHSIAGYVQNQYGRRYYIDDNQKAYKLANYLIQGTCADMLKEGIIEIDRLLLNYKSRFIMNIHDELQFEIWKGEEFLIPEILKIMQSHEWHYVPIVSDVEVARTTWAEKEEWAV